LRLPAPAGVHEESRELPLARAVNVVFRYLSRCLACSEDFDVVLVLVDADSAAGIMMFVGYRVETVQLYENVLSWQMGYVVRCGRQISTLH
jgi:hypothetical protein